MKILFCTNAFDNITNGPAKFAHILLRIKEFYPQYEVRILTEDCKGDIQGTTYRQHLKIPGFMRPAGQFLRMFQYYKMARRIKRRDYDFDLLIFNYALIGAWSSLRYRNTIVFINDDCISTSRFRDFFKGKLSKYHIFRIAEYISAKFSRKVFVNSQYLYKNVRKAYNLSESKLFIVPKCIEFTPIIRQNFADPDNISILFVKNDHERGGLFILVDALKQLKKKLTFVVAGTFDHVEEILKKKFSGTDITLVFKGIQTQQQVYELMVKADIFCVPSLKEALGVANIEAMALGCSVISTTAGGIPEVLDNGNCGWLVPPSSVELLAAAFEECFRNPEEREKKRKHAYTFVQKFSVNESLSVFASAVSAL